MIAAGKDVEPIAEQLIGERRRDAEPAGGIFRVGDRQMNLFGRDDIFQMPRDKAAAGRGENVANKKKVGQEKLSKERTTLAVLASVIDPELLQGGSPAHLQASPWRLSPPELAHRH